jgi:hypothetical protein
MQFVEDLRQMKTRQRETSTELHWLQREKVYCCRGEAIRLNSCSAVSNAFRWKRGEGPQRESIPQKKASDDDVPLSTLIIKREKRTEEKSDRERRQEKFENDKGQNSEKAAKSQ